MSEPTCTAIDATLGAVVTDVDLNDVDDDTWGHIHAAFLRYGVLVFPGQHLGKEAQGVFAHRFGDRMEGAATGRISNEKRDGSIATAKDEGFRLQRGNEGWHIDSTYMPLAAKAGMLSALKVPAGGRTDGVRGHAGGLGRARRGDAGEAPGPLGLPLAVSLAEEDRLRPQDGSALRLPHQGRAAAADDEAASGDRAHGHLRGAPRLRHSGHGR